MNTKEITESHSQAVAFELSKLLADEYVLFTKTRNALWNLEIAEIYDSKKFLKISLMPSAVYLIVLLNVSVRLAIMPMPPLNLF